MAGARAATCQTNPSPMAYGLARDGRGAGGGAVRGRLASRDVRLARDLRRAAPLLVVAFALGQGLMYGTNMTCALGFLPAGVKADGNAMFTTLQQLSGAVGTSVTAAVVNAAQAGVVADGMAAATLAGTQAALVVLVAAVVVALACAVLEAGLAALRPLSADAALVAACLVGADARATGRAAERLAPALLLGRQWQVVAVLLGWLLHGRLAFFSPLR